jgi:hypothetical protein
MRYRVVYVNYWQQGDNKCQFGWINKAGMILNRLITYTYAIFGLAQKLHYFCSPIKTLTGDTK